MKKALIFGVTGQDGWYLTELLRANGVETFGVSRHGGDARVDVTDRTMVENMVAQVRPDFVFHFAASSSTAHEYLWENHGAIGTGTLNILDAIENHAPTAKVMLAGSALQFVNAGHPLDEEAPLGHSSPYVVARNYSLQTARYFRSRGLKAYFAYLFNHDSPRRSPRHLSMRIAMAAASSQPVSIGDLDAEKEFTFAGDAVAGMWTMLQQEGCFEMVVGSGEAHSVKDWAEACYGLMGLDWSSYVKPNADYASPYKRLVSNPSRLKGLGWRPSCSFDRLAALMMEAAKANDAALRRGAQHSAELA